MDVLVIIIYLVGMVLVGYWGKRQVRDQTDYLVAGRRLGPFMYMGTLSALVLGGASTIGGVGLGYEYGIAGMWLVVAISCGILLLSAAFAPLIQRLKVFTVSQALDLRYGAKASLVSAVVMWMYTLMLSATSTIAYGTIFKVLLDLDRVPAILLGGLVVLLYSSLGGMWSVTLTDIVQFLVTTVGLIFILLPVSLVQAGGVQGIKSRIGESAFDLTAIGGATIATYFVIYFFGLLIGQDIWQRVFTARSPQVARYAGLACGLYCLVYAVAGALIGAAGRVIVPGLADRDDAYVAIAEKALPAGLTGIVLAAALAAVMSTASGSLIATATVARQDIVTQLFKRMPRGGDEVTENRYYVIGFGVVVIVIAIAIQDVVAALTIAYDVLVGGLLIPIIGGLVWRRATAQGALAAIVLGTVGTIGTMIYKADIYANEPIYVGLGLAIVSFIGVSLLTPPTAEQKMQEWDRRKRGEIGEPAPVD
ncbi:MAG: sodium:solute symporter [Micrococcales bacterium]|nr:sodium:solute symporter [Micrococcales bacterium]